MALWILGSKFYVRIEISMVKYPKYSNINIKVGKWGGVKVIIQLDITLNYKWPIQNESERGKQLDSVPILPLVPRETTVHWFPIQDK